MNRIAPPLPPPMPAPEPSPRMRQAAAALFPGDGAEQEAFLRALLSPAPATGPALVWTRPRPEGAAAEWESLPRGRLPPWLPERIEVAAPGAAPGGSRAWREGRIYSLDYSSVLAGSAMLGALPRLPPDPRVLDLCAAPGGKSVLASALLAPGLLLANETDRKRLGILRHNLGRCGIPRACTQSLPPAELARLAGPAFDLVLADAPCTGQSLLAKGQANPGCFRPAAVKGNARRQVRILAAGADAVRPGGFLLYTTCTFSRRENEEAVERLLALRPGFEPAEAPHLEEMRSALCGFPAYRLLPHRGHGAGGFACLLRREGAPGPAEADSVPLPAPLLDYPVYPAEEDPPPPSPASPPSESAR